MKEKQNYGAAFLMLSAIILKGCSFFFRIFLSGRLGDLGMGYFNAAYTVYTFFFLLCAGGVPKAVAIIMEKNEAKYGREERETVRKETFDTLRKTFLKIAIFASVLLAVFSGMISIWIGSRNAFLSILCIAPSVFFVTENGVVRGLRIYERRFLQIALSDLSEGVFRVAFGVMLSALVIANNGAVSVASGAACLGISLASAIGYFVMKKEAKNSDQAHKLWQNKDNSLIDLINRERKTATISDFFAIALPITLSGALLGFSGVIDLSLVIRRLEFIGFSEEEASAFYGNYTTLAVPMFHLVSAFMTPLLVTMLPALAKSSAKSVESLSECLSSQLKTVILLTAPCAAGYFFFSSRILSLLFSKESVQVAAPLLVLLSPALLFSCVQTLLNTALEASGAARASLYSVVGTSVVKLVSSFLLVGNPAFAISGAPIGAAISYACGALVSFLLLRKRGVRLSIRSAGLSYLFFATVSVFFAKLLMLQLDRFVAEPISTLLCIVFAAVSYLLFLLIFDEKRIVELFLCRKTTKSRSVPCV